MNKKNNFLLRFIVIDVRPLFLIPFCYFSYKRTWAGISITIFCLFTSMFWFNPPETIPEDVQTLLQFEKDWLYENWNFTKWLLLLTIPASFFFLDSHFGTVICLWDSGYLF